MDISSAEDRIPSRLAEMRSVSRLTMNFLERIITACQKRKLAMSFRSRFRSTEMIWRSFASHSRYC